MSEALSIETRSRSRSKTPGLLFGENGDSHKTKKIPTISLIEEEDVEFVSSQPSSQKPKRARRSGKTEATSSQETPKNSQESTKNSQSSASSSSKQSIKSSTTTTTTTTTVVASKQVINGSEEKNEQQTTATTTKVTTNSGDIAAEVPESQNIFNNIFNAIKTSTPILSNKRSKRVTQETAKSSEEIDYNAHPAYKEYKEAGEYWNKYPKTDYTYSELSPHRRVLGKGVVAMPNMSRRSLDKYTNRVETMIQNNPAEESFLRRKFLSNMSYQKRSADLQYDSADEVDVSDLHLKLAARRTTQTNIFRRFILLIVSTFSAAYSSAKQGVQRIYYGNNHRYSYTPIKRQQQQGFFWGVYNALQRFVLLCVSKVYLFISTVLCLDTWLLYTRSENAVENRKRKRFFLGLLIFLPLLLFGGTYIYIDPPQNISFPKITLPNITLPKISFPSISLPNFSFNFSWPELSWPAWLKLPSFEWPQFSFELPSFSLPSWFRLPSFSFNLPDFSFSWPEFSFSWPAWLALPALAWPAWLALPDIALSWPEWFTLPEISFSLSWPEWLQLPSFSFSWPEWLALPSFSFSWPEWLKFPEISFSWPEWLTLPEFSLPKFSMPSISFEFLTPIATYTADAFSSFKLSSIEFFDKIRDATTGALNEAQIVWNENFNAN